MRDMHGDRVDIQRLIEELEGCLRDHDREAVVVAVLSAVERGLPIEDLYLQVFEPLLALVGRSWQEGRTAVWEEHLFVGAVRTAIDALYPLVIRRKQEVSAVPTRVAFFCPSEEAHDVGLRMLVDRFDLRGFRTVYVGAFTPVDQMVECVRELGAEVVCLSASSHFQRVGLRAVVERLREALPDTRIVVGGPAFALSSDGWEDLRPDSVEALLDELAGSTDPSSSGKAGAQDA